MFQRWIHAIFGHSPVIRITEIKAKPDADPCNYTDPGTYNCAKFGATVISVMCPCGRGAQQVLLGSPAKTESYDKELAELRRIASL